MTRHCNTCGAEAPEGTPVCLHCGSSRFFLLRVTESDKPHVERAWALLALALAGPVALWDETEAAA